MVRERPLLRGNGRRRSGILVANVGHHGRYVLFGYPAHVIKCILKCRNRREWRVLAYGKKHEKCEIPRELNILPLIYE